MKRLDQFFRSRMNKRHFLQLQLGNLHAVLGQGAGLVHRQHGNGTQALDCRHAPGQHLALRDPPRTEGEEHGEDDRDFLGQDGHGQGNAGKQAFQQALPIPQPVDEQVDHRQQQADDGQVAHQAPRGALEAGGRFLGCRQCRANAPDCRRRRSRGDFGKANAAGHQGAGKEPVLRRVRQLGHRHRFAGQQRFVGVELAVDEDRVGGDAIAFMQHQQVTDDHIAASDAQFLAIAHDQRARCREVAQ